MTAAPPTFPPKVAKVLESLRVLKWRIESDGSVRCANGWCPMSAAGNLALKAQGKAPKYVVRFTDPGRLVGLTADESYGVAYAADDSCDPYRPHLLALLGIPKQNR